MYLGSHKDFSSFSPCLVKRLMKLMIQDQTITCVHPDFFFSQSQVWEAHACAKKQKRLFQFILFALGKHPQNM